MSSQTGRNEHCPCGSGKKYKNCCQKRGFGIDKKQQNKIIIGALIGVALIASVVVYSNNSGSSALQQPTLPNTQQSSGTLPSGSQTAQTGYTPQPGPAPPGKVWSPEHGHWHDAPGTAAANPLTSTSNTAPIAQPQQGTPQPGPAPPGKVWSAEHGHWHDAPGAAGTANPTPTGQPFDITAEQLQQTNQTPGQTGLTTQPPGPAPEGKVWSPEHGHWHDAPPEVKVIENNTADKKESGSEDNPK